MEEKLISKFVDCSDSVEESFIQNFTFSLWTGSLFGERVKKREEREGKGWEPVDKHLGLLFKGTHCTSDPDASTYWREHWLLTGLIYIAYLVGM